MRSLVMAGIICATMANTAIGSEVEVIVDESSERKAILQKGIPYHLNPKVLEQARHPISLKMINALWHHFNLQDTAETLTKIIPPYDSNIVVRFAFPTIIDQMKTHLPDVSFDEVSGQLINHASSRASYNPMSAREVAFVVCDYLLQLGHETVTTFAAQILPSRRDFSKKSAL